jgi:hypothetical protein
MDLNELEEAFPGSCSLALPEQRANKPTGHRKVQDLEATVAQQAKGLEVLTAQLKEQAAQIQKVSAQLETSKPAPKVVMNTP